MRRLQVIALSLFLLSGCVAWDSGFGSLEDQIIANDSPTLDFSLPANGQSGVAIETRPVLGFTQVMDLLALRGATTLTRSTGDVVPLADIRYQEDQLKEVVLIPANPLIRGASYSIEVATTACAAEGRQFCLLEPVQITFTAQDPPPPPTVTVLPSDGSLDVDPRLEIQALFDQDMIISSVIDAWRLVDVEEGSEVSGAISTSDARAIDFLPDQPLRSARDYELTLSTAARSVFERTLAEPVFSKFSTGDQLLVQLLFPQPGEILAAGTIDLEWAALPEATRYQIQVAHTPDFSAPLLVDAFVDLPDLSLSVELIEPLTVYWRVRPVLTDGATWRESQFDVVNEIAYVDSNLTESRDVGNQSEPCRTIRCGQFVASDRGLAAVHVAMLDDGEAYFESIAVTQGIDLIGGFDAVTWQPVGRTRLEKRAEQLASPIMSAFRVQTFKTKVSGFHLVGDGSLLVFNNSDDALVFENMTVEGTMDPPKVAPWTVRGYRSSAEIRQSELKGRFQYKQASPRLYHNYFHGFIEFEDTIDYRNPYGQGIVAGNVFHGEVNTWYGDEVYVNNTFIDLNGAVPLDVGNKGQVAALNNLFIAEETAFAIDNRALVTELRNNAFMASARISRKTYYGTLALSSTYDVPGLEANPDENEDLRDNVTLTLTRADLVLDESQPEILSPDPRARYGLPALVPDLNAGLNLYANPAYGGLLNDILGEAKAACPAPPCESASPVWTIGAYNS